MELPIREDCMPIGLTVQELRASPYCYLRRNVPYVFIMFDGVYGQCKPGFNVTARVLLETEHYLAENFIFDDRQYEQHARRRREISFSSIVEFESLSFGSEENELGACVMLIWRGLFV